MAGLPGGADKASEIISMVMTGSRQELPETTLSTYALEAASVSPAGVVGKPVSVPPPLTETSPPLASAPNSWRRTGLLRRTPAPHA